MIFHIQKLSVSFVINNLVIFTRHHWLEISSKIIFGKCCLIRVSMLGGQAASTPLLPQPWQSRGLPFPCNRVPQPAPNPFSLSRGPAAESARPCPCPPHYRELRPSHPLPGSRGSLIVVTLSDITFKQTCVVLPPFLVNRDISFRHEV